MRALVILWVGTIVVGALVTPLAYTTIESLSGDGSPWPYARIYNRICMLAALALMIAMRRGLGLGRVADAWRREAWPARGRACALGVVVASLLSLAILPLTVEASALEWKGWTIAEAAGKFAVLLPIAIAASLLEEAFFRVLVLGILVERTTGRVAVVAAGVLYAGAHFLSPERGFEPAGPWPLDSLETLAAVAARFADPVVLRAALGLFLIGLALGWTFRRTGSLALCVGLHAGWYAAAKVAVYTTRVPEGSTRLAVLGEPLTWLSVLLSWGVVAWAARRAERRAGERE